MYVFPPLPIPPPHPPLRAMQMTDDEEWQRTAGALSERKAVQLVAEAILLQVWCVCVCVCVCVWCDVVCV